MFTAATIPPLCLEVVEAATVSLRMGINKESAIPKMPTKRKMVKMELENGINAIQIAAMVSVSWTATDFER